MELFGLCDESNTSITAPDSFDPEETQMPAPRLDLADITDADAFQMLSQGYSHSTIAVPNYSAVVDAQSVLNNIDASNSETTPTVVIEKFSFGNPGAPIPGMRPSPHGYESRHAMEDDLLWAPFVSRRDWLFARWAKMHGTTSSAVEELLAIPEVSVVFCVHIMPLISFGRS